MCRLFVFMLAPAVASWVRSIHGGSTSGFLSSDVLTHTDDGQADSTLTSREDSLAEPTTYDRKKS